MVDATKVQHTLAIISLHLTRRILRLLLSTPQRQSDMNGRNGPITTPQATRTRTRARERVRNVVVALDLDSF
jgi:hypothetical protein